MAIQRAVIVGISKQALNGQKDCPDIVESRPFVLEYVQADVTICVHIRMEARSDKLDCWGSKRVAIWKGEA